MQTRIAVTALALLVIASGASRAQATTAADTGRTLITTTGQARATTSPDRAIVTLLLEPQAMSVEEASTRVGTVERAVLDTLRRLNLPASSITTVNSGVAPYRNQMSSMAAASFSGRSAIRVETSRLDLVPAITAAALAKGASFVSPPVFSSSQTDSVRRSLIPQAFQQARREAEALATAAGGRLGRLVSTGTSQVNVNFAEQQQAMFMANMMYDNGQRSLPGNTVSVIVTTSWTLVR